MSETTINLHPHFSVDASGKLKEVTLPTVAYVTLLVRANVTDPALWPTGMEGGAAALKRVREIEAECITTCDEFDWEKLPEAVQDEYDSLCALLDQLQDTGERIGLRDLLQQESEGTV
ncbi:hypothetical protein HYR99_28080 [Candidatus Poribacteria bacterium]|nr:hypothetical protein [Candidatus Poribacteria bacterium]